MTLLRRQKARYKHDQTASSTFKCTRTVLGEVVGPDRFPPLAPFTCLRKFMYLELPSRITPVRTIRLMRAPYCDTEDKTLFGPMKGKLSDTLVRQEHRYYLRAASVTHSIGWALTEICLRPPSPLDIILDVGTESLPSLRGRRRGG